MPAGDRTVEARLQRLEDAEEIRQLLLEYAACLDAGDHAAYSELFTEDGELHAQLGQATGREAIRDLLDARLKPDGPPRKKAFHHIGSAAIEVDGDGATSKVIWAYITHDDDGYPMILQLGHYNDVLARENGRWRFQRRTITRDLGFSPLG